jgi:3-oxoacyl-[acyl-carrier protein] reductase
MSAADAPIFPDLAGRVAVVTGGSKGIGRATCELLAANGCRVAVVARAAASVDAVVEQLTASGGEAIGVTGDAADAGALAAIHRDVAQRLGPVDVLLPFAGGFQSFSTAWETTLEEWDTVLRDNLTSTFLALREFLPSMIERRSGAVVLMSSISARSLDKLTTASYAAAKAGVLMLMRHAAIEAGPHGIRINAIAPGTVTSERIEQIMDDEALARTAALSPLGRLGTPADCAAAAAFLASDASGWMTGVTLDVAGGRAMV